MDKDEFEGKWKQIRGKSKIWWRRITDSDLNKVEMAKIKYFEFVTRLQLRYELDRQVTKDIIDRRVAEYEAKLKSNTANLRNSIARAPKPFLPGMGQTQTDGSDV